MSTPVSTRTEAGARSVPRRYVSEKELSVYSGIARRTLQKHRLFGVGAPFHKLMGSVKYDLVEFDEWVARQPRGGGAAG
jgi:hypothetical protein